MSSPTAHETDKQGVRERLFSSSDSKSGFAAFGSNLVFGGGACIAVLGLGTFLSPGCLLYIAYTSTGVGVLGGVGSSAWDSVPGSTTFRKFLVLAVLAFGILASGILLPETPNLNQPSTAINLTYFTVSAIIAMGASVYVIGRTRGTFGSLADLACKFC